MTFPLLAALVLTLPTAALSLVVGLVLWLLRKKQRRYWSVVGWLHLGLFPLHLFVTFPAALGYVGAHVIGTRGDERSYVGPRILASGELQVQTKRTLRAERESGEPSVAARDPKLRISHESLIPSPSASGSGRDRVSVALSYWNWTAGPRPSGAVTAAQVPSSVTPWPS